MAKEIKEMIREFENIYKDNYNIGDIVFVRAKHPSGIEEKTFGHIGIITGYGCGDYEVDYQYWYTAEELRMATDSEIRHVFTMLKIGQKKGEQKCYMETH